MRAIVVSILLFAATLPAAALAQSGYYFPVLETEISSEIVIGVVQSGTITDVAVTTIKTSRESSGSNTVTNTDVAVRNVEETRTKATNPAKRASRPKASGLLGGIVGAIGGDYSGLSQWGAGFVDHMMEPRDVTNVSKTFLTKNNRETRTVTTSASSWSNQNDFESTVTQNFQADISKGFHRLLGRGAEHGRPVDHDCRTNFRGLLREFDWIAANCGRVQDASGQDL